MAGFIAFLVFPSERDIVILFAIVVWALILYIGNNGTKLRLKFDKWALFILCAMMCSSILVNIYKFGLEHIEPAYLFLFRVCGILVFIPIIQNVHFSKMRAPHIRYWLSSGCVYCCSFFFKLISIATLGLNATILVLLFWPVCTYFLSSFVLKEEITLRKIVMSVLLIFIIVWAFYL